MIEKVTEINIKIQYIVVLVEEVVIAIKKNS